ncbi:thioredoxin family protein [Mycoplasmatota bacterium WC30]
MKKSILIFTARYCGKCFALKKRIDGLVKDKTYIFEHRYIDVEVEKAEVNKYYVEGVPTLIYFEDNQEITRLTGSIIREDLIELLK